MNKKMQQDFEEFCELYEKLKNHVRKEDSHLFERWKAGGFLVDTSIVSMYPNMTEVFESLDYEEEEEEEE